jgi:hypothetical protein
MKIFNILNLNNNLFVNNATTVLSSIKVHERLATASQVQVVAGSITVGGVVFTDIKRLCNRITSTANGTGAIHREVMALPADFVSFGQCGIIVRVAGTLPTTLNIRFMKQSDGQVEDQFNILPSAVNLFESKTFTPINSYVANELIVVEISFTGLVNNSIVYWDSCRYGYNARV